MYSVYSLKPNYDTILGILSLTKTNSSKTSSLPLAAFWHPERNKDLKTSLFQKIGIKEDLNLQNTDYCFEYPTPAYDENGKKLEHSKPSMTDLMILLNDEKGTRITIEAKYTEYVKGKNYDPLKTWYKRKPLHKTNILKCWINYIGKRGKISSVRELEELLNKSTNIKFPYQFLHRTASACFNCNNPILVYQLFYDNDKKSLKKKDEFKKLLSDCANILLYDNKLPFFIVETEAEKCPDSTEWNKNKKNPSELFSLMKENSQYEFGKKITVLDGYTLTEL